MHRLHEELGDRLVDFAGWGLPIQFAGIIVEHQHIRKSASLFDVSHMGQVLIYPESGSLADAAAALEILIPTSATGLREGRQRYGLFTGENGGILDDLMFANHDDHYSLVVNTARSDHNLELLRTFERVTVEHTTDRSLLALQGSRTEEALAGLTPDATGLRFIGFRILDWNGVTVWISHSGYIGGGGSEIPASSTEAECLVRTLLGIGWVLPAGLGARGSLRLGVRMPLHRRELSPQVTPVKTDLGRAIPRVRRLGGSREGGFPGVGVILKQLAGGTSRKQVGLRIEEHAPTRKGAKSLPSETATELIAEITSGGFDPTVGDPITMTMLPTGIRSGVTVHAEVRGRRLPLTVIMLPFIISSYKR